MLINVTHASRPPSFTYFGFTLKLNTLIDLESKFGKSFCLLFKTCHPAGLRRCTHVTCKIIKDKTNEWSLGLIDGIKHATA